MHQSNVALHFSQSQFITEIIVKDVHVKNVDTTLALLICCCINYFEKPLGSAQAHVKSVALMEKIMKLMWIFFS